LSRRWAFLKWACMACAASSGFALPAAAQDSSPPPTPPPPIAVAPAVAAPETVPATLDAQIAQLRADQEAALAKMRAEQEAALAALRSKQAELEARLAAQGAQPTAHAETGAAAQKSPSDAPAPGVALSLLGVPVRIFGNATLRYDYSVNSNLTDTLSNGIQANWFLLRVRFGAEFGDKGPVLGGIRLSSGETPNPTVPFVALADAFRPAAFGVDQAWAGVRPFNDRDRLQLTVGRMKNPFWRGSIGTVRTQMLWDDDVNPAGAALTVQFYRSPVNETRFPFKVENAFAYTQIQSLLDTRFVGLTGVVSGFADQLRFLSKYVDGALSYYEWINLNTGLSVPTAQPASGYVSAQNPTSAFLLLPGLQQTNTVVNYGPGGGLATGFLDPTYKILNPTLQVHVPFMNDAMGDPDAYVLVDYAHNFLPGHVVNPQGNLPTPTRQTCASCTASMTPNNEFSNSDRSNGVGVTLGTRFGDKAYKHALHPINVWVTYRYVQSDAALATFADSDLGAGTGYNGWALGTNYRIFENLMASVQYFDFMGYPLMENHVQRLFLDLMGDF
jgi:hypothetical protein